MIEFSSASFGVEDTSSVRLEDLSVGFNGDWDWTLVKGSLKLADAVSGNSLIVGSSYNTFTGIVVTFLVLSFVWIVRLGFEGWFGSIIEGKTHISTIATSVTTVLWAINELLFREWNELVVGKEVVTFEGTDSWESPAWTALTLIFNWGDSSLSSPVEGGSIVRLVQEGGLKGNLLGWLLVTEKFLVFSWGIISEFVGSKNESVSVLWVKLVDLS